MGSTDLSDSKTQLVAAFLEVMQCSEMEAEFYLESSKWDIATAISLCVDANPKVSEYHDVLSTCGKRVRSGANGEYQMSAMSDEMYYEENKGPVRYNGRGGNHKMIQRAFHRIIVNNVLHITLMYFSQILQYHTSAVVIEGLDPAWTAAVQRSSGKIYFTHIESGFTQFEVPPGFDDYETPVDIADENG